MVILDARTATPHYPGIGRYTLELARALTAMAPVTLLLNPVQVGVSKELWSLPARRVAVPHSPRSVAQQWILPTRLHPLRADVYHSPFYLFPYFTGVPTVVTVYDLIPLHPASGIPAAQQSAFRFAHRLAFMAARRVITLSEAARHDFLQRFRLAPEKIVAIPPGLGAHFSPVDADSLHLARQKLNLPGDYLLSVGINKPHKNLTALVHAYATLPADAPPLLISGPQDSRYLDVRAAAATFGLGQRVRLLGRVADEYLPALYAGATAYVHPSLAEGFGFPVLEAMGCGTPVVCSDIPVLRELTANAAFFFDPHHVDSIAATLADALHNGPMRRALAERGLLRARYFTWDRAAERTLKVYASL
jgi:alpha-1,3-rhamnosyl/mannosyltransferase